MRWNLTVYPRRCVRINEVRLRVCVDGQLSLCANDLCCVLLTVRHHSRAEKVSHLAAEEFHDADRVVVVPVLLEPGGYGYYP